MEKHNSKQIDFSCVIGRSLSRTKNMLERAINQVESLESDIVQDDSNAWAGFVNRLHDETQYEVSLGAIILRPRGDEESELKLVLEEYPTGRIIETFMYFTQVAELQGGGDPGFERELSIWSWLNWTLMLEKAEIKTEVIDHLDKGLSLGEETEHRLSAWGIEHSIQDLHDLIALIRTSYESHNWVSDNFEDLAQEYGVNLKSLVDKYRQDALIEMLRQFKNMIDANSSDQECVQEMIGFVENQLGGTEQRSNDVECDELLPSKTATKEKWRSTYTIMTALIMEFEEEFAEGHTKDPMPSWGDFKTRITARLGAEFGKYNERSLRKIKKAGDAGCLDKI